MAAPTVTRRGPDDLRARRRRDVARRGVADLLGAACWASAALAVALYLATGTESVGSVGDVATTLGVVTGLIGTDFVLVMLVLAARVPFIDRTVGHDRALALHRRLGKPAFFLLLAHGALLTIGYASSSRIDVVAQAAQFLGQRDILWGVLALGLFVVVIVSSLIEVRRRLPYEGWHAIHLLTYLAVLGAAPHQFSAGGVFLAGSLQRVYWLACYAIAAGSILVFRIAAPIVRSVRHGMVVEHVERVAADAVSIHIRGVRLSELGAQGGQFFVWRFWTPGTWWHSHPVSLSSSPTDTSLRITVRELGAGTSRLARLRPGTRVSFGGPYGVFTDASRTSARVAIFASGIGVTPGRALLDSLTVDPRDITMVVRASRIEQLFLWPELVQAATERGMRLFASIGPRAGGRHGWLSATDRARGATLETIDPGLADSDVYICGPGEWADLLEKDLLRTGVPAARIHREQFSW